MEHILNSFILFVGILTLITGITLTMYAISVLGPVFIVAGTITIVLTVFWTHHV